MTISDYDVFMADLRNMIKVMFTHAIAGDEGGNAFFGMSDSPRIVSVDLTEFTVDGRLVHLNKVLFIFPVGDSGLSIKTYAFCAFDKIGNTIYFIPNRETREAKTNLKPTP